MKDLQPSDIAYLRLQNQQCSGTEFRTATEMVSWFGAVQGQEYAPTKWSLGLRLPHLRDEDVEDELNTGGILRTHLLRPTWHLVAAADIRWLLRLTAPRVHQANAFMYRKLELDQSTFNRCNDVLIKALEGGKQLTRRELNADLKAAGIEAEGHRLSYLMMQAELEGLICSGPRRGNQFTYTLLEERAPPVPGITREEALLELSRRYFAARGPATLKDLSTWSGLTMADCKQGVYFLGPELITEQIGTETYFFFPTEPPDPVNFYRFYLLPLYDELIMGYKDRAPVFRFYESLTPRLKLKFHNMILFDGQVVGTWRQDINPRNINVDCNFFEPPDQEQICLFEAVVQQYSLFKGVPAQITGWEK